jgi:uncharacterized protein (DUF1778 family)
MATRALSKSPQGRTIKESRITARVTGQLKERIEEAAMLSGRSLTEFVVEAIQEKADEVIREQHILELSQRDMEKLLAAIENPPAPNEAMMRAVARWREHGAPE